MSPYLRRPLRSEAQALADRRKREAAETFAAPRGLAESLASAVAFYAMCGTLVAFFS